MSSILKKSVSLLLTLGLMLSMTSVGMAQTAPKIVMSDVVTEGSAIAATDSVGTANADEPPSEKEPLPQGEKPAATDGAGDATKETLPGDAPTQPEKTETEKPVQPDVPSETDKPVQTETPAKTLSLRASSVRKEVNPDDARSGKLLEASIVETLDGVGEAKWSLSNVSGDAATLALSADTGAKVSIQYKAGVATRGRVSATLTCTLGDLKATMPVELRVIGTPSAIVADRDLVSAKAGDVVSIQAPKASPEGTAFPSNTTFKVAIIGEDAVSLDKLTIDAVGTYEADVIATFGDTSLRAPITIEVKETGAEIDASADDNTTETTQPEGKTFALKQSFAMPVVLGADAPAEGTLGKVAIEGDLQDAKAVFSIENAKGLSFDISTEGEVSYSGLNADMAGAEASATVRARIESAAGDEIYQDTLGITVTIAQDADDVDTDDQNLINTADEDDAAPTVTRVVLASEKSDIAIGESTFIFATLLTEGGADIENPTVVWQSSDPAVLQVERMDDGGAERARVTALAAGDATITATVQPAAPAGMARMATMSTGVSGSKSFAVPFSVLQSITMDQNIEVSLKGGAVDLNQYLTCTPAGNYSSQLTWSNKQANRGTVNPTTGVFTPSGTGAVNVTVTHAESGKKATAKVTVIDELTAIEITRGGITAPVVIKSTAAANFKAVMTPAKPTDVKAADLSWDWTHVAGDTSGVDNNGKSYTNGNNTYAVIEAYAESPDGSVRSNTIEVTFNPTVESAQIQGAVNGDVLLVGDTVQLSAKVLPENPVTPPSITWKSSNTRIATVDKTTGLVTAVGTKTGDVNITATVASSGGINNVVTLTVKPDDEIKTVDITGTATSMGPGGKITFTADVQPAIAPNKAVTWYVVAENGQPTSAATIAANGELSFGSVSAPTKVKVYAVANVGGIKSNEITISLVPGLNSIEIVEKGQTTPITAAQIDLSTGVVKLELAIKVNPDGAVPSAIAWTSSDAKVASINATKGIVTAKKVGTTTITADADGKTATLQLTVIDGVTQVTIAAPKTVINAGETLQFTETVLPADAADKTVSWLVKAADGSAVPSQISISSTGLLSTAGVTDEIKLHVSAKSNTGSIESNTIEVAVIPALSTVSIAKKGETSALTSHQFDLSSSDTTLELSTLFVPSLQTPPAATWSSDKAAVASVDSNGKVTAHGVGTATITVSVTDFSGVKTATLAVTVIDGITGITIASPTTTVKAGETIQFTKTLLPANSNKPVVWYVENVDGSATQDASIDANGLLIAGVALAAKQVKVYATTVAGDVKSNEISVDISAVEQPIIIVEKGNTTMLSTAQIDMSQVNATLALDVALTPAITTTPTITWRSSNASVATIDADGIVTANMVGKSNITATIKIDGKNVKSNTLAVTVYDGVTKITIAAPATSVDAGDTLQFTSTVEPAASTHPLVWHVTETDGSATTNATIDANGLLTANFVAAQKTVRVHATSQSGSVKSNARNVKIVPAVASIAIIESGETTEFAELFIDMNQTPATLNLAVITKPVLLDKLPSVKWESSDTDVATVTNKGIVNAVDVGTTTITATATTLDLATTIVVKVIGGADSVTIDAPQNEIYGSQTLQFTNTFTPANAADKRVTWHVEAEGGGVTQAATIDANGLLTAADVSTVQKVDVYARTVASGAKSPSFTVTIHPTLKSVSIVLFGTTTPITTASIDMAQNKVINLATVLEPGGVSVQSTDWASDAASIAKVDKNGKVTAIGVGTATITASVKDKAGNVLEVKVVVTVYKRVEAIAISAPTNTIRSGETLQYTAAFTPADVTDKSVTWKVTAENGSATTLASIDKNGLLTASAVTSAGKVKVFAQTKEGVKSNELTLTIGTAATSIAIVKKGGTTPITTEWVRLDAPAPQIQLDVLTTPALSVAPNIKWSSNNSSVATVAADGSVTAKASGTVNITATSDDGNGNVLTSTMLLSVSGTQGMLVVSGPSYTLVAGQSMQMERYALPQGIHMQNFKWAIKTSAGEPTSLVNISSIGRVTASTDISVPTKFVVSASATVGNTVIQSNAFEFTVMPKIDTFSIVKKGETAALTSAWIDFDSAIKTLGLDTIVNPSYPGMPSVTWSSSNSAVASIAQNGLVTAHALGMTTITAKITNTDGTVKSSMITLSVGRPVSISIKNVPSQIPHGTTQQLTLEKTPSDISISGVKWFATGGLSISTTGVLSVGTYGVDGATGDVYATADDTLTGQTLKTETYKVKIYRPVTSVNIYRDAGTSPITSAVLYAGQSSMKLTAKTYPVYAREFEWSTSNSAIATIAVNGDTATVSPISAGTCVITATTKTGNAVVGSVMLTVHEAASALTVTPVVAGASADLTRGNALQLKAVFNPTTIPDQRVTWAFENSLDANYATLGANYGGTTATITAKTVVSMQEVTVVATSVATGVTGKMTVRIYPELTTASILVNGGLATSTVVGLEATAPNHDLTLRANIVGYYSHVSWSSSAPGIIGIEPAADGLTAKVVPVKVGTATITMEVYGLGAVKRTAALRIDCRSYVETIQINGPDEIVVGQSMQLTATVSPATAANKAVTWKSANPAIVSVIASSGVIRGVSPGTTTIQAQAADGTAVSNVLTITVKPSVASLEIQADHENGKGFVPATTAAVDIQGTGRLQLRAVASPGDAAQEVQWVSSNPAIATVDGNGLVRGWQAGNVTVTAKATDSSGKYATILISVGNSVRSIKIDGSGYVGIGKTVALTATVEPAYATNKALKWESLTPEYASVSNAGVVQGKVTTNGAPIAKVKAMAQDGSGVEQIYEFVVSQPASSMTILVGGTAKTAVGMNIGEEQIITAQIFPAGVSQEIQVTSSNLMVASVEQINGKWTLKGIQQGTANIVVKPKDGSALSATLTVTVGNIISNIEIVSTPEGVHDLGIGRTLQLTAVLTPENATYRNIEWKTSDAAVAVVSANGLVGAAGTSATYARKAVITATAKDGNGATATYDVWVRPLATALRVEHSGLAVTELYFDSKAGDQQLVAKVDPLNIACSTVNWSSDNATVVSVDETGKLKLLNQGKATITAKTIDGSAKVATVLVHVVNQVQPGEKITVTGQSDPAVLASGRTTSLKAALPKGKESLPYEWVSETPALVSVNQNGVVTAFASITSVQTAFVTVVMKDGSGLRSTPFPILVYPSATSLSVGRDEGGKVTTVKDMTIGIGQVTQLIAIPNPSTASAHVDWKSTNAGIASVAADGKVTGHKRGQVAITATARDGSGLQTTVTVNVIDAITGLKIVGNASMANDTTQQLTAIAEPNNTVTQAVAWASSNTSVASITATGALTAKGIGTTTITATTTDGTNISADAFEVEVMGGLVTSLVISREVGGMSVGNSTSVGIKGTRDLYAVVNSNASNQVVWTTSNSKIVSINTSAPSSSVTLTGVKAGTATITASATDGSGKVTSVTVKVIRLVEDMEFELTPSEHAANEIQLQAGKSRKLKVVFTPSNPADKTVTWQSSKLSVASVDSTGKITANANAGVDGNTEATITAYANDGSGEFVKITVKVYR